jgi:hypothetical protein
MPLQDRVANVLERLLGNPDLRHRPVAFVCHSLGGLIVKQLLLDLNEQKGRRAEAAELFKQVRRVIFIATPHSGSRQATWMDSLRLVAWPTSVTQTLVANDPSLRKLNVSYRGLADDRRSVLRHLVFYETQGTAVGSIVNESSSDPGLPGDPPIPIDADHLSISKPLERSSLIYERSRTFIAQIADHTIAKRGRFEVALLPELPRTRSRSTVPKVSRVAALIIAVFTCLWALDFLPWKPEGSGSGGTDRRHDSAPPASLVLAGEILDAHTKEPLQDVLVTLPELNLERRTSAIGRYEFVLEVAFGSRVRLRASREGYQSIDEDPQVGGTHVDVLYMERVR